MWRSMYSEHLQRWLKVYPPESMLVVPSEHLKVCRRNSRCDSRATSIPAAGVAIVVILDVTDDVTIDVTGGMIAPPSE